MKTEYRYYGQKLCLGRRTEVSEGFGGFRRIENGGVGQEKTSLGGLTL